MNVKPSTMFGTASGRASDIDSWAQQGRKHRMTRWKTCREETRGCSENPAANVTPSFSALLETWRQTFKMQQQLSLPKPAADIWNTGPLAPRRDRKRDGGQREFSISQGHRRRGWLAMVAVTTMTQWHQAVCP